MKKILHRSEDRGASEYGGWLSSRFSFSFADYYNPEMMNFGALRVLNDDIIAAQHGFGMHEHHDMEIISIPLQGLLQHKDSLGNEITIGPDDVQVMSAGSGVVHSEMNPSSERNGSFLQIWIMTRNRGIPPHHDHTSFDATDQQDAFITLVQPDTAEGSALQIHADAYISRGRFSKESSVNYSIQEKGNGAYIFSITGSITIDGQKISARDAVGITETDTITIHTNGEEIADILIIEVPMEE